MFISFIAPTYNVNRYLDDFFRSFIGIDKEKFEIILINDNGEDPSKYVEKYKSIMNIKFINLEKNVGVDFVRNVGIKEIGAKSTHFSFIDPDDVIFDKNFINVIKDDKIVVFDRASFTKIDTKIQRKKNIYSTHFWGSIWGIVFPISVKENIHFYYKANSDVLTQREILFKFKNIVELSSIIMINRRIRKSSLSNASVSREKMIRQIDICSDLVNKKYKPKFNTYQELYWLYFTSRKEWSKEEKEEVKNHILEKAPINNFMKTFFRTIAWFMRVFGLDKKQFLTDKKGSFE